MIDVVDFFCGCGGTSAGLRNAGLNILAGIDINADAGKTYQSNFPAAKFFLQDIQKLSPSELVEALGQRPNRQLLFAACAPCQPFTKQKTSKREFDERKGLLDHFHKFVKEIRPDFVVVENVPGLQRIKRDEGPLGRFIKVLAKLRYKFDVQVISSQDYGVPQIRRRLVLIASRHGKIAIPTPTHGLTAPKRPYETVWNWIGDLPPLEAGQSHESVSNHRTAALSDQNARRIRATPENGGRLDWPADLTLDCHKTHSGHTDVYGRLFKDRPASALSTRCISLSNGRYGHPTQHRAISVREAARLQTFDDDFEFFGSLNSMARQIGNAVPVKLAEALGRQLLEHVADPRNHSKPN
ncbi:DNA cytosine methyltransferase [Phyllobacterium sp. SB3]|uniref:DNA cytosine methyltransferase n=1 Tax=Phyllobacterium sp. SB3 TaxID=3156073 RepID=UPI0032AEF3D0